MKKKFLTLSIALLSGILIIAQSKINPVGIWKNVSKDGKTSFSHRFDANGKGSFIKDARSGINDKCDCLSSMKYPFTWFINKDSVFMSFAADSSSSSSYIAAKPGMTINNKELAIVDPICTNSVQYVFINERKNYIQFPNRKSKIDLSGNTLTISGLPYIKQ